MKPNTRSSTARSLAATDQAMRGEDTVMASFLSFLAADMVQSPESIVPLSPDLKDRIDSLVGGMTVDPDEDVGDVSLLQGGSRV